MSVLNNLFDSLSHYLGIVSDFVYQKPFDGPKFQDLLESNKMNEALLLLDAKNINTKFQNKSIWGWTGKYKDSYNLLYDNLLLKGAKLHTGTFQGSALYWAIKSDNHTWIFPILIELAGLGWYSDTEFGPELLCTGMRNRHKCENELRRFWGRNITQSQREHMSTPN